jgi:exosortase
MRSSATSTAKTPDAGKAVWPWVGAVAAMLAVLVWSYWLVVEGLIKTWQRNQNYNVGQLVPLAALYLLWHERAALARLPVRVCWWGLALLLFAQAARGFGLLLVFESVERYALVLSIVGVVLLVAGWRIFWQIRWILVFLFLMVPLPARVHNLISGPLQDYATGGAVFVLELMGTTITREGNVMVLNGVTQVAVAEACSGLRMLTAFVVVGSVLAYIVRRPTWQKAVLVISTVPVAIVCNLIRLVVTAELFAAVSSELANTFFHDFAGLTMMPIAIFILVGELWLMAKLVIPEEPRPAPARS